MKSSFKNLLVLVMIASFVLAACQPKNTGSLVDTSWILVELNGQPALSETTVTLNLNGETITGNDGCNQFGGTYTSEGDSFKVNDDLMGTLMACEESIMNQAGNFNNALREAQKYLLTDDRLTLLDENGNALAIFEAQSQELAGSSWLATFVLIESSEGVVSSSGIQAAQQTLNFTEDGKINGNAGCNEYFSNYEVDANELSISAIGSTKMFCGDGLMAEETAFLTALEKAASYRISGDSLQIFAADDSTLISFSRTE